MRSLCVGVILDKRCDGSARRPLGWPMVELCNATRKLLPIMRAADHRLIIYLIGYRGSIGWRGGLNALPIIGE